MRSVSVAMVSCLRRVSVSSSAVANAVSSVVVTAGSAINSSTTGENDGHASRLEEVLIREVHQPVSSEWKRETYVVPRVGEVNGPFPPVLFAHFADEHYQGAVRIGLGG